MTLDPSVFTPLLSDPLLRLHLHALDPAERARHLVTLALTHPTLRAYAPGDLLSAAHAHPAPTLTWHDDARSPVPSDHPHLISRHGQRGVLWDGHAYQRVTLA